MRQDTQKHTALYAIYEEISLLNPLKIKRIEILKIQEGKNLHL